MFSSWRPNNLPSEIIRKVNSDIILAVTKLNKNVFSGRVLDFIFNDQHGITSHGFEMEEHYKVFIKPGGSVLIIKNPEKEKKVCADKAEECPS